MKLKKRLVNAAIVGLSNILCRVDAAQLADVPHQGPLILVANHVNFLDVPLLYTRLMPRPVRGFAKAETWRSPFLGFLANVWEAIPLQRGVADVDALRQGLDVLHAGHILAIAPEGTRSGHGRLQRGHSGVAMLALKSGAPLQPLVYFGGEQFHRNFRRLRRTDFRIAVGRPFKLDSRGEKITREMRAKMTDEIMYQLAALLPHQLRGEYADMSRSSAEYLRFDD